MTQKKYEPILTEYGKTLVDKYNILSDEKNSTEGWYIALGTGELTPTQQTVRLTNVIYDKNTEGYKGTIFVEDDNYGNYAYVSVTEAEIGKVTIREIGLFDNNDKLVVVGNCNIPISATLTEGQNENIEIGVFLRSTLGDSIEITTPPGAFPTTEQTKILISEGIGEHNTDPTAHPNLKHPTLPLFSTLVIDHVLTGDEAVGWALQGSLVTNTYPDAVSKISALYSGGTETEHRGISCKRSADGRYIADISQKDAIDLLYSETGVAEFYIFDSVNERFYLPKSKWFMQLTDDTSLVNGYNEAGLPNIAQDFHAPAHSNVGDANTPFNITLGTSSLSAGVSTMKEYSLWSFDASRASSVYGKSDTVQPNSSNKLLYYKVGNTVSNDSLVDVGNVLSELQLKADADLSNCTKPYVTQTYRNGSSWYRIYSDGFKIQAGVAPIGAASVTFAVAFSNLDTVNIQAQMDLPAGSTATYHSIIRGKSLTGFELYEGQYALNLRAITSPANWIAFGY